MLDKEFQIKRRKKFKLVFNFDKYMNYDDSFLGIWVESVLVACCF